MTVEIRTGDCRELLRAMPDESVHCVVTSPPYWGLRDYGTAKWEGGDAGCDHIEDPGLVTLDTSSTLGYSPGGKERGEARRIGENNATAERTKRQFKDTCGKCGATRIDSQLGLEQTPAEYVERMVEVFREVRRVLRKDGTLWLNLGSSYGRDIAKGQHKPGDAGKQNYIIERGGGRASAGMQLASQSRQQPSVPACGSDDIERPGSEVSGSACFDLCGECRAAASSHISSSDQQPASSGQRPLLKDRDNAHQDSEPAPLDGGPPFVLASTRPRSSEPLPAACSHCANCGACLSVLGSSSRDGSLCARMAARIVGTWADESVDRNRRKDALGTAWLNYTPKPKDMVPIPWLVAMALQADGWWLRQDIIWAKPNPMPESVTDRCTKSHEYLFLLTKSERYYYDSEAIAEPSTGEPSWNDTPHSVPDGHKPGTLRENLHKIEPKATRNKRSVWTVTTQPFSEAHFATFPPALIEPCILAGCPEGGTVLDPFGGAGTTGLVSDRHHRNAILLELNPEYAAMAKRRIEGDSPLFAQVTP